MDLRASFPVTILAHDKRRSGERLSSDGFVSPTISSQMI
jgi:hypothetical protein